MARPYRWQAQNCLYHITSRGDDRKKIFLSEADSLKFLEYLKIAKERFRFYFYAYCLMPNHYHILLEITHPNLSKIMQHLNTSYTVYYNTKRKRCGHLFQGRFKSILVEKDSYFAELTRYIHLNPVKAKIVDAPERYVWSSYNAYLGNKSIDLIDIKRAYELLSMNAYDYRQFVQKGIKNPEDPFKKVYAGFILGSVNFIKDNLKEMRAEVESKDFAHKRAVKNIIDPQCILKAVADYFKVDTEFLRKNNKRPMMAKNTAIYLLRNKTGLTNLQVGEFFDMKMAAVSKAAISFKRRLKEDKGLMKAVESISSKVEV